MIADKSRTVVMILASLGEITDGKTQEETMITDCYDKTEPLTNVESFYGKQKHIVDKCLIIFSAKIHDHLLDNYDCELIGIIGSCNGNIPIYAIEAPYISIYILRYLRTNEPEKI